MAAVRMFADPLTALAIGLVRVGQRVGDLGAGLAFASTRDVVAGADVDEPCPPMFQERDAAAVALDVRRPVEGVERLLVVRISVSSGV